MSWNVLKFLNDHRIPYKESGKNVAHGNVNIRCPLCGANDPSEHMGINLETGYWACWRDPNHRGKSPLKLVTTILGCTYQEARDELGITLRDPSELEKVLKSLQNEPELPFEEPKAKELKFPKEFKGISKKPPRAQYFNYLTMRGFNPEDIKDLCKLYELKCCDEGYWRKRIIVPVYEEGKLVTWVGRSISKLEETRYLNLSTKPDKYNPNEVAVKSVKSTILNYDLLIKNPLEKLYICEGPFDALKVDYYGRQCGIRATCLYGINMSEEQHELILEVSKGFKQTFVLLDRASPHIGLELCRELVEIGPRLVTLPDAIKDPGDIPARLVCSLL